MDKKIIEILKLVSELNRKGEKLSFKLDEMAIDIFDKENDFKSIIPHRTNYIYFHSHWKDEYKNMVEGTLEALKGRLKNLTIIKEEN